VGKQPVGAYCGAFAEGRKIGDLVRSGSEIESLMRWMAGSGDERALSKLCDRYGARLRDGDGAAFAALAAIYSAEFLDRTATAILAPTELAPKRKGS
jgi:hypothetical protein